MKLEDSVVYHIYALGALGAPRVNDRVSPPVPRIAEIARWIPAIERIGANTLLLGPVFESERHGYDSVDIFTIDRRLGTNPDLVRLASELERHGISLVLDAVFNHVGRSHPLVRDVAEHGESSRYARWIAGFDPSRSGQGGLPFGYENWAGHDDLVRLDTSNDEVREYLIGAVLGWIGEFGIAGLRLDAADRLDPGFTTELGARCRKARSDFFLIGEAVHGDGYARLLENGRLDSVTNYEAYKGLWSSYNDRNYHEIAWTLNRLFGASGLCRDRVLYSFADNHDVDRVASSLRDSQGLYPLYGLMFAMPGIPSVYYGSEFGVEGRRSAHGDTDLRPEIDPERLPLTGPHPGLADAIGRFAEARRRTAAVRNGNYRQLAAEAEAIAFLRSAAGENALIAVNAGSDRREFHLEVPEAAGCALADALDPGYRVSVDETGRSTVDVPPAWLRWLVSVG